MKKLICYFLFAMTAISLTVQAATYEQFDLRQLGVGEVADMRAAINGIPDLQRAMRQQLGLKIDRDALEDAIETRSPVIVGAGEQEYKINFALEGLKRALAFGPSDPVVYDVYDVYDATYPFAREYVVGAKPLMYIHTTVRRLK